MTVGMPCPECGNIDSHEAMWWTVDDETKAPVELRLHCMKCEHAWTERMD